MLAGLSSFWAAFGDLRRSQAFFLGRRAVLGLELQAPARAGTHNRRMPDAGFLPCGVFAQDVELPSTP